ncbi:acetylcholinesterase [Bisporella sp. PMI_857]|nr:acetylcholinesterase [Bisporella sp. PMI_857]
MFQKILSVLPLFGSLQSNNTITLPTYGSFAGGLITQTLSGHDLSQPVQAWLGIPYSAPPVASSRFAPTTQPLAFPGVRNATRFGNICVQPSNFQSFPDLSGMGEDCLYMNVFRPADTKDRAKLPVLVWVHGGSFIYGSSLDFDGATFVASSVKPLIVVTFNYRLNSLGFLPSKLFKDHDLLNLGLRDQHALLKFVQKHIPAFGGDPGRVTVGGLSAGAHSAGFHYQHVEANGKPLLNGAIIQSGGPATRAFPNISYPLYQAQFEEYLSAVGCSRNSNDEKTLDCLRKVDIAVIERVSTKMWQDSEYSVTWPFQPVSEAPLVPQLPSRSWAQGKFNRVPLLTSFTTNEGAFYAPTNLSTTSEALAWIKRNSPFLTEADLHVITELYPSPSAPCSPYASSHFAAQYSRLVDIFSDMTYICAAQENAIRVSSASVPVYKMHFNTNNSRPAYRGIDHATDKKYAWADPSVQYPEVGRALHAYWASFVVSGDPNTHKLREAPAWPRYDKGGTELGVQLKMSHERTVVEKDTIRRAACEFWRARHERLTR